MTVLHSWQYRTEFFLKWEMFDTAVAEKSKHTFYVQLFFSRKSCSAWDNVEKYCTAGQDTNENIIWHKILACWLTKTPHTHTQYM